MSDTNVVDSTASEAGLEEKRQLVRSLTSRDDSDYYIKGYFNPKIVRMILFYVIGVNLFAAIVIALAGIWSFLTPDLTAKSLFSFGVIVIGAIIFNAINEYFGE